MAYDELDDPDDERAMSKNMKGSGRVSLTGSVALDELFTRVLDSKYLDAHVLRYGTFRQDILFPAAIAAHPNDEFFPLLYAEYLEHEGQSERAEHVRGNIDFRKQQLEYMQWIVDRPEDDALRLEYAALLDQSPEEADRARGEFIRLQITIEDMLKEAKTPRQGDRIGSTHDRVQAAIEASTELQTLIAREDALKRQYAIIWMNSDMGEGAVSVSREGLCENSSRRQTGVLFCYSGNFAAPQPPHVFERGMIREVFVGADNLLAHAETVCKAPIKLNVDITSVAQAEAVFALPQLQDVRDLKLAIQARLQNTDAIARIIADSPHMQQLRALELHGVTDNGLEALASSANLKSLEKLVIKGRITGIGLRSLGNSAHLSQLCELEAFNYEDRDRPHIPQGQSAITPTNWPTLSQLPNFVGLQRNHDGNLSKTPERQRGRDN